MQGCENYNFYKKSLENIVFSRLVLGRVDTKQAQPHRNIGSSSKCLSVMLDKIAQVSSQMLEFTAKLESTCPSNQGMSERRGKFA
jgi:hypothetical protein